MRHSRHAILAFGFLVASVTPLQADDKEAQALIAKAIKAHGGAEAIAKFPGLVAKYKSTANIMGKAIAMTGEVSTQGGDKHKIDVSGNGGGWAFRTVTVLDGNKGWIRDGGNTRALNKQEIAEYREEAHVGWVASLTPLTAKGLFTLATADGLLVNGKPALGVKVSAEGHQDVTLYFDKETGMLVKFESLVKDDCGKVVTEEQFPSEYKGVQGTKQAMKVTKKRGGVLVSEAEFTAYQLFDKLCAGVFAKP